MDYSDTILGTGGLPGKAASAYYRDIVETGVIPKSKKTWDTIRKMKSEQELAKWLAKRIAKTKAKTKKAAAKAKKTEAKIKKTTAKARKAKRAPKKGTKARNVIIRIPASIYNNSGMKLAAFKAAVISLAKTLKVM